MFSALRHSTAPQGRQETADYGHIVICSGLSFRLLCCSLHHILDKLGVCEAWTISADSSDQEKKLAGQTAMRGRGDADRLFDNGSARQSVRDTGNHLSR